MCVGRRVPTTLRFRGALTTPQFPDTSTTLQFPDTLLLWACLTGTLGIELSESPIPKYIQRETRGSSFPTVQFCFLPLNLQDKLNTLGRCKRLLAACNVPLATQ